MQKTCVRHRESIARSSRGCAAANAADFPALEFEALPDERAVLLPHDVEALTPFVPAWCEGICNGKLSGIMRLAVERRRARWLLLAERS